MPILDYKPKLEIADSLVKLKPLPPLEAVTIHPSPALRLLRTSLYSFFAIPFGAISYSFLLTNNWALASLFFLLFLASVCGAYREYYTVYQVYLLEFSQASWHLRANSVEVPNAQLEGEQLIWSWLMVLTFNLTDGADQPRKMPWLRRSKLRLFILKDSLEPKDFSRLSRWLINCLPRLGAHLNQR